MMNANLETINDWTYLFGEYESDNYPEIIHVQIDGDEEKVLINSKIKIISLRSFHHFLLLKNIIMNNFLQGEPIMYQDDNITIYAMCYFCDKINHYHYIKIDNKFMYLRASHIFEIINERKIPVPQDVYEHFEQV